MFTCVIGYMVTTHSDLCRYQYLTELNRRAVIAATLLDTVPDADTSTQAQAHFQELSSTSNVLTVGGNVLGPSTVFPYRSSVTAMAVNISVTDGVTIESNYSCAPLSAGQGLCILLCYLAVLLFTLQLGNLLAGRSLRLPGIALCWVGLITAIAFMVGLVVMIGRTQRMCAAYERAEEMTNTVQFAADLASAIVTADSDAVTADKIQLALNAATAAIGAGYIISLRTSTFPSTLAYYNSYLGGGTLPSAEYATFIDDDRSVIVTATYKYSDVVGDILFYIAEVPLHNYVLDEEYVSYALTLGVVPLVVLLVVAVVLLPYPSLGALESGVAGIFPWQWRISQFADITKWGHLFMIAFMVLGMCTVGLTVSYGNRAVVADVLDRIVRITSGSTAASSVSASLLDTLVLVSNRQYGEDSSVTLPDGSATASEVTTLNAWYVQVVSRVGTMTYNDSSLVDTLASVGLSAMPLFLNQTGVIAVMGELSTPNALVLNQYGKYLDMTFLTFARNSNGSRYTTVLSDVLPVLRTAANESDALLQAFDAEWAAYEESTTIYTTMATSFQSQPYNSSDVRALYNNNNAVAVIEDNIVTRQLDQSDLPPITPRTSIAYGAYQIESALWLTLPAVILLSVLAIADTLCTHYFFGLGQRWVPANDPTAVGPRLLMDHKRLVANLRFLVCIMIGVCVLLVVLSSIFYAQAVENATLRYNEGTAVVVAAVEKKRLLRAVAKFMTSAFFWTRGSLSQSSVEVDSAVASVLEWSDYLADIVTLWPAPISFAVQTAMTSANTHLQTNTKAAVLACGFRLISDDTAFNQLTEMLDAVYAIPQYNVSTLEACYGSDQVVPALDIMEDLYLGLTLQRPVGAFADYAARFSALDGLNPSCSLHDYITNMSYYAPFIGSLLHKDDRIAVGTLGLQLRNNATAAQDAVSPLFAYQPVSGQLSSHFAVFWVPVLLLWAILPALHCVYQTTSDSVQALH